MKETTKCNTPNCIGTVYSNNKFIFCTKCDWKIEDRRKIKRETIQKLKDDWN